MKTNKVFLSLCLIFLLASFYLFINRYNLPFYQPFSFKPIKSSPIIGQEQHILIGNQILRVEMVKSSADLTQGLSGREEIGGDGMLFVMPQKQVANFWMKDMKFDLDFVFIGEGAVLEVISDVKYPQGQEAPRSVQSAFPVDYVLELEAGQAKKWDIKQGDQFSLVNSGQ